MTAALAGARANDVQALARSLGVNRTMEVVSELLYAHLPEEAVLVAMDGLKAEHDRLRRAEQAAIA